MRVTLGCSATRGGGPSSDGPPTLASRTDKHTWHVLIISFLNYCMCTVQQAITCRESFLYLVQVIFSVSLYVQCSKAVMYVTI